MESMIMIVALMAVMYFFMIRPENKRKKQAQNMRDSLKKGDMITTIGGIVGKIVMVNPNTIVIETSDDRVRMELTRWAFRPVSSPRPRRRRRRPKRRKRLPLWRLPRLTRTRRTKSGRTVRFKQPKGLAVCVSQMASPFFDVRRENGTADLIQLCRPFPQARCFCSDAVTRSNKTCDLEERNMGRYRPVSFGK